MRSAVIGRLLGDRWRIGQRLGVGGYGAVYYATDEKLNRHAAVKILEFVPDERETNIAPQRFLQEALATAALRHLNVVQIYDADREPDGLHYMAMELLIGEDLDKHLKRVRSTADGARLDVATVCHIGAQVCGALAAVHRLSIVHRDLKPANIRLLRHGNDAHFVKVLDFGIAKVLEPGVVEGVSPQTATGLVAGTPGYLSPEQALGDPVTPKSDLYSLGAILYELLAGKRPFAGKTPVEVVTKHVRDPPPPLPAGLPPALDRLVMRMLEKDPEHRPASAEDVETTLRSVAEELAADVVPPTQLLDLIDPTTFSPVVQPPPVRQPSDPQPPADPTGLAGRAAGGVVARPRILGLLPVMVTAAVVLVGSAIYLLLAGSDAAESPPAPQPVAHADVGAPDPVVVVAPEPEPVAAEPPPPDASGTRPAAEPMAATATDIVVADVPPDVPPEPEPIPVARPVLAVTVEILTNPSGAAVNACRPLKRHVETEPCRCKPTPCSVTISRPADGPVAVVAKRKSYRSFHVDLVWDDLLAAAGKTLGPWDLKRRSKGNTGSAPPIAVPAPPLKKSKLKAAGSDP